MEQRNYRFRIYPSRKQIGRLNNQFVLCQYLYNTLLAQCKKLYKAEKKSMTEYQLNNLIKEIKDSDERFKSVHSQVLQNISDRLIKAYQNFFRRVKEKKGGKQIKVGFPRFKKFYKSITYPQSGFKIVSDKQLYIAKVGNVPLILHRIPKGKVKCMTIKRTQSGKWFVVFSCETEIPTVRKHLFSNKQVGIDVGIEKFATFSNGDMIKNPRFILKSEKKLSKCQRRLSRKKKGSNNRRKARIRVARTHEKITNQRQDFLHKTSRNIANNYGLIGVENLSINNMVRNHCLAKHITDASWNNFLQMLDYKVVETGGRVIRVNPRNTTQTCSRCGAIVSKDLSIRTHKCSHCGLVLDRDVNSAINILNSIATVGQTESHACGDLTSTSCLEQEASQVAEAGTI